MRMNVAFTFKYFDEWFELQVASWRDQILFAFSDGGSILIPTFFVIACFEIVKISFCLTSVLIKCS